MYNFIKSNDKKEINSRDTSQLLYSNNSTNQIFDKNKDLNNKYTQNRNNENDYSDIKEKEKLNERYIENNISLNN
ncbi:MAG: hypothetical protein MJ252_12470, partial [archaeon]|nr:hypothetical protein [archaeon]